MREEKPESYFLTIITAIFYTTVYGILIFGGLWFLAGRSYERGLGLVQTTIILMGVLGFVLWSLWANLWYTQPHFVGLDNFWISSVLSYAALAWIILVIVLEVFGLLNYNIRYYRMIVLWSTVIFVPLLTVIPQIVKWINDFRIFEKNEELYGWWFDIIRWVLGAFLMIILVISLWVSFIVGNLSKGEDNPMAWKEFLPNWLSKAINSDMVLASSVVILILDLIYQQMFK